MMPDTSFKVDNLFTSCNISLVPSLVQELDLMVRVGKYHICHFIQDPLGWLCAKQ
jgi:hypothetical protein